MGTWSTWDFDLAAALGIGPLGQQLTLLRAWQSCEGGSAAFNPLNTTQPEPGATNYNSAGVKNYPDKATGLKATVDTLRNGNYDGIVHDLEDNSLSAASILDRNRSEFATWGTDPSCIASKVGGIVSTVSRPAQGRTHQRITVPQQPASPGIDVSLSGAWHELTRGIGVTLPTRTHLSNILSRGYHRVVS